MSFLEELYKETARKLKELGYEPHLYLGDGSKGLAAEAPFDGIVVTAAAPDIPKELVDQLDVGGKLVIPVGDNKRQRMVRVTRKTKTEIDREVFNYFSFVPLRGEKGW